MAGENEIINPFVEAVDHVEAVRSFVTSTLNQQLEYANATRDEVNTTLAELQNFAPVLGSSGTLPPPPNLNITIDTTFDMAPITPQDLGEIRDVTATMDELGPIRAVEEIAIDPFEPSVAGLNIPEAPPLSLPPDPGEAPEASDVDIPPAPDLVKPTFPELADIVIPAFTFPTLPTWDASAPEFEGTSVSAVLQWGDPEYAIEILDEQMAVLREIWAGGNGIPAAVEQAMWERAASREDLDISRQVSAAFKDFSSRGFTEPPGALAARVDAIREEGQIKKQGLNREVAIKMAELHVENVRFACEQAVAAENVLFNIWNNIATRRFEAAKIEMEAQLAIYNAQVSLFNARQSAYATEATVFKARLDAALSELQIYKMQLDGELAKGQLNEQEVRIYSEQVKALMTDVEIYKAQMQGAQVQADVNRTVIEGFRAEVQAYAERIGAEKIKFEAYDSRVKGELGKAQVLDAEARAYASYVSGQSTVADIRAKVMQADIARNEQIIKEYIARLDGDKARIQSDVERVNANAKAFATEIDRYKAELSAEESTARLQLGEAEAEMRSSIAMFEAQSRLYIADMEQLIRKANLQLEALKAAGQMGSTLAAGAMAGLNIGASLGGSGSISASGSQSNGYSRSNSVGYSYSNDTTTAVAPVQLV